MTAQESAYTETERLAKSLKDMPAALYDGLDRVHNLEPEIVCVDSGIDKLGHVLYGLTEKELKIVEGS